MNSIHPRGTSWTPAIRALVAQELAEPRPVARGAVDQAAADHRARAVEFGHHRGHAERIEQAAVQVIGHRPPARVGVAAVGRSTRAAMSARITVVVLEYSNFAPGSASSGWALGPAGHVVAPVEEQHAHFGRFVGRIACFLVAQARSASAAAGAG